MISVDLDSPFEVCLRQERLLLTGDVSEGESRATWWVPLSLPRPDGENLEGMHAKSLRIKLEPETPIHQALVGLNPNRTGFYRVNYPPGVLDVFTQNRSKLSANQMVTLIADVATLAVAGKKSIGDLLNLLEAFHATDDYL